ncbi:hypothetical protein CGRA01v4_09521 [Colletotrichum graminicola]|nr:hypothetical protein CGRA01v4_09521 [Colletotrichum graminicola]
MCLQPPVSFTSPKGRDIAVTCPCIHACRLPGPLGFQYA